MSLGAERLDKNGGCIVLKRHRPIGINMAEDDWAAVFRPNTTQTSNTPLVEPTAPQELPRNNLAQQPTPSNIETNMAETMLSSIAEMFMLLEQRTRESLVSIIESQEQQGLLIARKFDEIERMINENGELPITNIDNLDPKLAEEIRGNLDEEVAEEPDFMPELLELEDVPTIADINELQISVNNLAEVVDELAPGILEIPNSYEDLEENEEYSLNHVSENEIQVPKDIKTAYWQWKEGNGTYHQYVKAAGGVKNAKKYRTLIEN